MELMLWNSVLTLVVGVIGWNWVTMSNELKRVTILLNKTREEVAKDYITRSQVHADMNRIMDRLDRLDEKLDRLMEAKKA